MSQPPSSAPEEEMRSPLPKPRRFAWFFQLIVPLLLCALCSVSIGIFGYVQTYYRPTPSTLEYYFPHLQGPGVRALSVPELEKNGYYLSVITTLPAAGPGRAARILLDAWSEHETALYSIDTDGRNLQRLPETLPCDPSVAITFAPDAHELTCQKWFWVYPFDPITLRVTGEKTLSDPSIDFAIWGPDSHQFVTSSIIGTGRGISFYRADATYSSISRTAILLFTDVSMRLSLISWSPDGRYLLFRGPAPGNSHRDWLYLLPLETIQKRLQTPASTPWSPGTPVAQIQPGDLISIATPADAQVYSAAWRPDGSSLTVIGGNVDDSDYWRVFTIVSVPTGNTDLLIRFANWPQSDFSHIGRAVWSPDDRLIFLLTTYSCTDNCRPIHIHPGNNLYVYTPPDQT